MKLLHFLLHICSKNCFDWCGHNIWATPTKFWGNAGVGSWIVNMLQICWWLQWLTQDSFLTFHRISCIFTNNPNMHTCRLSGNDVAEKRWAPKFAAGQVCIWMYSGCNSALQFPTEKNSPPCLFTSNFANKYKYAHTDICRKKSSAASLAPESHGRFVQTICELAQCQYLVLKKGEGYAALTCAAKNVSTKVAVMDDTLKIGSANFFYTPTTHRLHPPCLYISMHDFMQHFNP